MDPEKKSLNFIFPTKYVIPKSLKFSHWLSEYQCCNSEVGWPPNLSFSIIHQGMDQNIIFFRSFQHKQRVHPHSYGCKSYGEVRQNNSSGQISIVPKPELRGFWGSSLIKPPFRVTSADVVIICPELMEHFSG